MPLSEKKKRWLAAHPELGRHQSMKRRHDRHDYQSPCIYMITLAIKGRRPLLGTVCDPDDSHPQPWFNPSPLGERIAACWREMPRFYPQVRLLSLQLMPDHLHGIIQVTKQLPRHLGHVLNGFKVGCNRVAKELSLSPLWEEGYNDRILQGKGQLNAMFKYLDDNPRRLWTKRNNPEFFKTQQDIIIGDQNVTVMGNRFLLDSPNKVVVKCSRKMTDDEIEHATKRFLMMAQRGAVLVSPRISPGEKAVMDMIQEAGFPFIQLLENGFSPMWKTRWGDVQRLCHRASAACRPMTLPQRPPYHHPRPVQPPQRPRCPHLLHVTPLTRTEPWPTRYDDRDLASHGTPPPCRAPIVRHRARGGPHCVTPPRGVSRGPGLCPG